MEHTVHRGTYLAHNRLVVLPDGERVPIQTRQSRTFRLVAVYDSRHSVTFDVPKTHRGEQLPGGLEPAYIAGLALNYIKELVQEAWTRVE